MIFQNSTNFLCYCTLYDIIFKTFKNKKKRIQSNVKKTLSGTVGVIIFTVRFK